MQSALAKLSRLAADTDCRPSTASESPTSPHVPGRKRSRVSDAGKDRGLARAPDHNRGSTVNDDVGESGAACNSNVSTSATSETAGTRGGGKGKRRRSSGGGCLSSTGDCDPSPVVHDHTVGPGVEGVARGGGGSASPETAPPRDGVALSEEVVRLEEELVSLKALASRSKGLFEWVDGPLVIAMRKGELLLLDELSLAEDAVLERLNSVLEPGRSITLAEKGGERSSGGQGAAETVVAASGFRWVVILLHMVSGAFCPE